MAFDGVWDSNLDKYFSSVGSDHNPSSIFTLGYIHPGHNPLSLSLLWQRLHGTSPIRDLNLPAFDIDRNPLEGTRCTGISGYPSEIPQVSAGIYWSINAITQRSAGPVLDWNGGDLRCRRDLLTLAEHPRHFCLTSDHSGEKSNKCNQCDYKFCLTSHQKLWPHGASL